MKLSLLISLCGFVVLLIGCSSKPDEHTQTAKTVSQTIPQRTKLTDVLADDLATLNGAEKPTGTMIGDSSAYKFDEFKKAAIFWDADAGWPELMIQEPYVQPFVEWKDGQKPEFYLRVAYFSKKWIYLEGFSLMVGNEVFDFKFGWDPAFSEILDRGIIERRIVKVSDKRIAEALATGAPAKVRFLGRASYVDFSPSITANLDGVARFMLKHHAQVLDVTNAPRGNVKK